MKLDAAFVELLARRAYDSIRVGDVARKGGVGRATFYAHYDGKDDLLASQIDRVVIPMLRAAPGEPCVVDATALFAHTRAAPRLFRATVSGRARPIVEARIEAHLARLVEARAPGSRPGAAPAIVARFVAASLTGLLSLWVEGTTAMSPDEMQATFRGLCGG